MHILVFLDIFVYFWSETAMVDNQRKAVLFGNNFQSFLISSQSILGQSHNISAILADSVLCQISIFCVWNVLFRLKLTFFQSWNMRCACYCLYLGSNAQIQVSAQSHFEQNIYPWSCSTSYGTEPNPSRGVPSGTDCWDSAASFCPHQANRVCSQGRNSWTVSHQGFLEPSSLSPTVADNTCKEQYLKANVYQYIS